MTDDTAHAIVQLKRGAGSAGPQRLALLAAIRDEGSIAAAAKRTGLSYKGAWDGVQALNNLFSQPLVEAQPGGRHGGAAVVTPAGQTVLTAYRAVEAELSQLIDRLDRVVSDGSGTGLLWRLNIKTSARNMYRGTVRSVTDGAVNAEVQLDIGGGNRLIAIVTRDSVADLGLAEGREAIALVKSSFVILVPGEAPVRTSARNCLAGTVARHVQGAVNDEVVLDLGAGKTLTAVVTRTSGERLAFAVGDRVQALIKASHIILAVD
jgi:molybdate transport system regulatory protein